VADSLAPGSTRLVWGVEALIRAVADALAARFSACTVRGEISGLSRASSGHCYFALKDADGGSALIRCAMFRRSATLLNFAPGEGQLVELRGRLAVYEPRGELQFIVESMQRAGDGALFEQFLRLKARLESEGLFDPARKRRLPPYPRTVGVVTSLGAAVLRDVAATFARRAPHVRLIVYPSLVQGADAPAALADAIAQAGRRAEVDLLIVCRGGGSLEDLWAFNDERVVRAIAAAPLPVISGVGHETDVTLADFVADLRAPTPTAAAELASPSTQDCLDALGAFASVMRRRVENIQDLQAQRLDRLALRIARPAEIVRRRLYRLDLLAQRLAAAARRTLERREARSLELQMRQRRAVAVSMATRTQRLEALGARLQSLDPQHVLARGYAWLTDETGSAVISIDQLAVGDSLRAVLADGSAGVLVRDLKSAG
jgi:exodeoxyribonuclease VII large subunit